MIPVPGPHLPGMNCYYFSSTTNIQAYRRVSQHTIDFIYYVVETNNRVACDNDSSEMITSGNATGSWTHNSIDWDYSTYQNLALIGSFTSNQTSVLIRGEDLAQEFTNTNSTTMLQTRGFTGGVSARASVAVYDFTNS